MSPANFGVEVNGSQIAKGSNENEVQNNEVAPLPQDLGAQSPPQLDSANIGVKVRCNQIAIDGSNVNEVQNNKGAPLQMGNHGVSIGGCQEAGKDNKNKVSGNRFGATSQPKPFTTQTPFEDKTQALFNPNEHPTQADPILVAAPTHNSREITNPPGSAPSMEDVVIHREAMKGTLADPSEQRKVNEARLKRFEKKESNEDSIKKESNEDSISKEIECVSSCQPKK